MKLKYKILLSVLFIALVCLELWFIKQQRGSGKVDFRMKVKTNSINLHLIDNQGEEVGSFDLYDDVTITFKRVKGEE